MSAKIRSHRREVSFCKPRKIQKRIFLLLAIASASLWGSYKLLQSYWIEPEAVIVLGGHEERERFAAELAKKSDLPIWVSSGSPQKYVEKIFANAGIDRDRLHLSYQAVDTVTNFTTLVDELKAQGINSVYLVTSDYHMRRAIVVGEIVFGSRGIVIKTVSVPSEKAPEPLQKSLRDGARAIFWLTTGDTGENLVDRYSRKLQSSKQKEEREQ
jgi:uncharacterized SAM-binding protein YcdF (DUF218 family)